MRAVTKAGLWGTIVLAAVGLGTASSMSAATDGQSSHTLLADAQFGSAFSGAARVSDDPDAPIRTGRWDAAPDVLAGGPPVATSPTAAAPPARPIELAALAPPMAALPGATRPRPAPVLTRAGFRSSQQPELMGGPPTVKLTVSDERDALAPGSGLEIDDRFAGDAFAPRTPRADQPFDGRRMLLSIAPKPADRKKGRWFIFAAGSGDAFGLNLIRDPARGGWRRAGWSVERLAEFGKAQLGLGWRRGDTQVALSAARREIGAYGFKREDTVVGVTFTVSGKPGQKVKREQRLPKQ